jgi:hypothetical protein
MKKTLAFSTALLSIFFAATAAQAEQGDDDDSDLVRAVDEAPPPTPSQHMRTSEGAAIAKDPPPDWAVLHAGLKPELGTFGGIGTLALAQSTVENFYGGFQFAFVRTAPTTSSARRSSRWAATRRTRSSARCSSRRPRTVRAAFAASSRRRSRTTARAR